MTFLPYLVGVGFMTLVVLFVWASVVWLPEFLQREQTDPLEGEPASIDETTPTGKFRRIGVQDDFPF